MPCSLPLASWTPLSHRLCPLAVLFPNGTIRTFLGGDTLIELKLSELIAMATDGSGNDGYILDQVNSDVDPDTTGRVRAYGHRRPRH